MGLAYCIKCKAKVAVKEGKMTYYSNGTPVEMGLCVQCGSKVNRILSKEERIALRENQKHHEGNESKEAA